MKSHCKGQIAFHQSCREIRWLSFSSAFEGIKAVLESSCQGSVDMVTVYKVWMRPFDFRFRRVISGVGNVFYYFQISVIIPSIASGFPLFKKKSLSVWNKVVLLRMDRVTVEEGLLLLLKIASGSWVENNPELLLGLPVTSSCCRLVIRVVVFQISGFPVSGIWIEIIYFWVFEKTSLLIHVPNGICPPLCKCWRSLNSTLPFNFGGHKVTSSKWG